MTTIRKAPRGLHIALWVVQILLSLTLAWAFSTKLFTPADKLAQMWPWTANNHKLVILTGILDLLAALGLVFPMLLRIKPGLTMYAAGGLILLMISAIIFHISRGEISLIGVNIVIAILAGFVAWGRSKTF